MSDITFGHLLHVPIGSTFNSYEEMNAVGVHRSNGSGISGREDEGADSVVVSDGYEDDEDNGSEIIYTGHGGNVSGKQVRDQVLKRGNLALVRSQLEGLPVRVIRGPHKGSSYAPTESKYRYDGLFRVESHWHQVGKSGFKVWRFRLIKLDGEPVEPKVKSDAVLLDLSGGNEKPTRKISSVERVVRDTRQAKKLKEHYRYSCQVCGLAIKTSGGFYAEAAHIRPLGTPHNGADKPENLLCLCPNHHKMLDMGSMSINDDLTLIGLEGSLIVKEGHNISVEALKYHREHFFDI